MTVYLHSMMIGIRLHHVIRLWLMIFGLVLGHNRCAVVSCYLIFRNVLLRNVLQHLDWMLLLPIIMLVVNWLLAHLIVLLNMMELARALWLLIIMLLLVLIILLGMTVVLLLLITIDWSLNHDWSWHHLWLIRHYWMRKLILRHWSHQLCWLLHLVNRRHLLA